MECMWRAMNCCNSSVIGFPDTMKITIKPYEINSTENSGIAKFFPIAVRDDFPNYSRQFMNRTFAILTNLFPAWVLIGGIAALFRPGWFTWFSGEFITWGLAIIMLGMGITLSVADFQSVLKMPGKVAIGFVAQYLVMPFLGWSIAHLLKLEPALAVGLILVSCCPGGTASNVVTYLARANVALSVLMTMSSTFGAIVMTPLLTRWLAGTYVPVNAWGLFASTVQIVLIPLILGVALQHFTPKFVKTLLPVAPLISVLAITLICASIIGGSAERLKEAGGSLLVAVFLLHTGGFGLGYVFAKLFRCNETDSRTVSIEVGMQNSGLGAALAKKHFPLIPDAALPCAISATFHSVIGSILAGIWRLKPPK
jgi:BASS family bile acid:Na+ symporter